MSLIFKAFKQGFLAVCKVHLVGFSVPIAWRGVRYFAKWSVKSGGKLRRVSHYRQIFKAVFIKRLSQRLDNAVHHTARCYHICASFCVNESLFCGDFKRGVIINALVYGVYDTTMPVVCVFAKAQIRDDKQIWAFLLDSPHSPCDKPVFIKRIATYAVFFSVFYHAKKDNRPYPQAFALFALT